MVNRRMCFRRLGHFVAGVLGIFYFGVDIEDNPPYYSLKMWIFLPAKFASDGSNYTASVCVPSIPKS